MALASSMVRVVAEPKEPRVAEPREKPGLTVSRFVPGVELVADALGGTWATLTRATTEATPMMMPAS